MAIPWLVNVADDADDDADPDPDPRASVGFETSFFMIVLRTMRSSVEIGICYFFL